MSTERDPATDQDLAAPNDRPFIQDLVITDIAARKELGIRKYGTALQSGNGRDMVLDAYEESLDLAIYLRGVLDEQRAPVTLRAVDGTVIAAADLADDDDLVEHIAEAMWRHVAIELRDVPTSWPNADGTTKGAWKYEARRLLTILAAALSESAT